MQNMDGLAGQMAPPSSGAMQEQMPTVEEVAALLMQGIDPQQLVEAGIPPELIEQAIMLLEQQMAAEQQPQAMPPATPAGQGLAGSVVQ